MNFWQSRHGFAAGKLLYYLARGILWFLFVWGAPLALRAEPLPDSFFRSNLWPLQINEYAGRYPNAPFQVKSYELWVEEPKAITQYLGLNLVKAKLKYLDDIDSNYFEYETAVEGEKRKGKLFLQVTGGLYYQILELRFVPYFDLREIRRKEREEAERLRLEQEGEKKDDVARGVISRRLDGVEQTEELEEVEEDYDNVDPIENPEIIPGIQDVHTGITIAVDIALLDENKRKQRLYRFDDTKRQIFAERYVYTSRGGLQRLVRSYANGAKERFIYYFSTGGLKEVYYQDRDGSSYLLRYTIGGDPSEKQIRDVDNVVIYDERNSYTRAGDLRAKLEIDYLKQEFVENFYQNGKLNSRKQYAIQSDYMQERIRSEGRKSILQKVSEAQSGVAEQDGEAEQDEEISGEPLPESEADLNGTEDQKSDEENQLETFLYQESVLGPLPPKKYLDLLYEESFRYNKRGDTTGVRNKALLHDRVTISKYDDDGTLLLDRIFLDGLLEYEIVYEDDQSKTEIFYYKNEPLLKVYYKNNTKFREEILENGRIIETRE